jgi:pimeloyl-ACP methyl ester carboxylesterase
LAEEKKEHEPMWKWTLRIAIGLIALSMLTLIGFALGFALWLPTHERALEAGSRIAPTPLGAIEYAVAGSGTPLLRIHGSPGGYDHAIASARTRPEDIAGFKVIAPSRPGYLRTPLSSGKTPAQQADLYAALLDQLHIERVVVWGVSGGGPSALQFAVRHPQRTLGLVLVVPALQSRAQYNGPLASQSTIALLLQDFSFWVSMALMNERLAAATMPKMMPGFDAGDALQMALVREIGLGFIPAGLRTAGRANDIEQYRDLGIEALPLESLTVPTLIVHGTADANAPYAGSKAVAGRMPNAELVTYEGGDHYIIITRAREIGSRTKIFMEGVTQNAQR